MHRNVELGGIKNTCDMQVWRAEYKVVQIKNRMYLMTKEIHFHPTIRLYKKPKGYERLLLNGITNESNRLGIAIPNDNTQQSLLAVSHSLGLWFHLSNFQIQIFPPIFKFLKIELMLWKKSILRGRVTRTSVRTTVHVVFNPILTMS